MLGKGVDYGSGPYNVIFPADTNTTQFDITINDDKVLDIDKNFILTINTSSLSRSIMVADPNQATVVIEDDDGKYYIKINYKYRIKINNK